MRSYLYICLSNLFIKINADFLENVAYLFMYITSENHFIIMVSECKILTEAMKYVTVLKKHVHSYSSNR